jgi:hypothetical protein
MIRNQNQQQSHNYLSLENIKKFKYLVTALTNKNEFHNEILFLLSWGTVTIPSTIQYAEGGLYKK